ncbi:MAG: ribosome biogenesis GTP-binding protein YihA/YsxC [Bacteroidia bacterium]|jgi:GTP-binding protein|nr:ribosome biogenesis GTP-binding protein YihA/YsxC [Bacteroidia bacterium]
MLIRSASFIKSSTTLKQCPVSSGYEFGFIGRSNVGKSSLINMLTGWSKLAKISGEPGKTRTINHFLINGIWYLVDLPGYGYAKVPVKLREEWTKASKDYILKRINLVCLFVLIDARLKPQKSDIEFMEFLGINRVPFARVFTKSDKIRQLELERSVRHYNDVMLKNWETLPPTFITSSVKTIGRDEILSFIEESINKLSKEV